MSKGLEALDNLRCMLSLSQDCNYNEGNDLCNIVEKELKELEERREMMKRFNDACVPTILDNETEMRLKALEIIKYKQVSIRALEQCVKTNCLYPGLVQEEQDLLKEVLL